MTTPAPNILVVGSTGRTGTATISALLAHPNPPQILALTRSPSSPKAQALLTSYPSITLVKGDPASPAPIFAAHADISAVYLVTVPPADEAQAIPLIDAAIASRVPHIVFASVDRGGDEASWETPTDVPHFAAKHRVELHLRDTAAGTETRWTVLRPSGFMDQYLPGAGPMGAVMGGLWATMPRDRKGWGGRAIALAGDEISFAEAEETFKKVVGRAMPQTWTVVGRAVRWTVEDAGRSMDWFEKEGYKADIEKLRELEPGLQNWEMWLRESSGWVKGD